MGSLVNILYICAEVESPLEKYVAAAAFLIIGILYNHCKE